MARVIFANTEAIQIAVYEYVTDELVGYYHTISSAATALLGNPQKAKNLSKKLGHKSKTFAKKIGKHVYCLKLETNEKKTITYGTTKAFTACMENQYNSLQGGGDGRPNPNLNRDGRNVF